MSVKILDNIDGRNDLTQARCECCGKPWEELKPGRLWYTHRSDDLPNEDFYQIMIGFFGKFPTENEFWNAEAELIQRYGTEKVLELTHLFYAEHVYGSYACIDCIGLNEIEYFKKRVQTYKQLHWPR